MLIDIPGPSGALQAQLSESPPADGRYAVLCHPHPQYGGSMHDTVLDILAAAQRMDDRIQSKLNNLLHHLLWAIGFLVNFQNDVSFCQIVRHKVVSSVSKFD